MSVVTAATPDRAWAEQWQRSWDIQQEGYMPDRETRLSALLDVVEAVAGPSPLVLDLACGTGSISRRLLDRFPDARSIAVDVDPALLSIARASFEGESRIRIVQANLARSNWVSAMPLMQVDAVVTATALHWLDQPVLRNLYRDLADVLRPGGVFANVDHMPAGELPGLTDGLKTIERRRRDEMMADGRPDWDGWWELVRDDPILAGPAAERFELFGGNHAPSFLPPASWHIETLREADFAEAGVAWRAGSDAMVAAIR